MQNVFQMQTKSTVYSVDNIQDTNTVVLYIRISNTCVKFK